MKKLVFFLVASATLLILNSCESKSGHRKAMLKAKADSISAQPELPKSDHQSQKEETVFNPKEIAMTPLQENEKDTCGEGQYACHSFSVDFIFTDSAGTKYTLHISEKVSKQNPQDEEQNGMKQAKKMYAEMTDPNLDLTKFKFVYHRNGKTLDVIKVTPNSGKKLGKVNLIDYKEEVLYSAYCNVEEAKRLYRLYMAKTPNA